MVRFTIITQGTHGDVQPYVALGIALQAVGHTVKIATATSFQGFVETHGLQFAPLVGDPQEMLASFAQAADGGNPLDNLRFVQKTLPQMGRDMLVASQGSEALLSNFNVTHLAYSVAEKLKIPFWECGLLPMLATRAYPNPHIFMSPPRWWLASLNRLTYAPVNQLLWQPFRKIVNEFRREQLGLSPYPFSGYVPLLARRNVPRLEAYSRHIMPPAPDWGERVQVTGFWYLPPTDWQPPPALEKFLAEDPKPLYIGFGSMNFGDAETRTRIILEALRRTKQRAVLAMGWGGMNPETRADERVFWLEKAPHDWLFPRVAGAIHHGGAGTTAAALRAGVPQWMVTFLGDQPFWGHRMAALGVAPLPIPRKQVTVEHFVQAIQQLQQPQFQDHAQALRQNILAEGGVQQAVTHIEQHLGR